MTYYHFLNINLNEKVILIAVIEFIRVLRFFYNFQIIILAYNYLLNLENNFFYLFF